MRRMIWKNLLYGKQDGDDKDKDKDKCTEQGKDSDKGMEQVHDKGSDKDKDKSKDKDTKKGLTGSSQLKLSPDVDLAAIASKYELTGGFIKNAVLSALLSAISRQKLLKTQGYLEGGGGTGGGHMQNGHTTTNTIPTTSSSSASTSASSSASSSAANGQSNPSPGLFNPTAHAQRNSLLGAFVFENDEEEPVICQADLIKGCKLQMRGSLSG